MEYKMELETEIPMGIVVTRCIYEDFTWENVPINYLAEQGVPQDIIDASLAYDVQSELNIQHRAYLTSTDSYVVRLTETGVPVPADILLKRQEARDAITEE